MLEICPVSVYERQQDKTKFQLFPIITTPLKTTAKVLARQSQTYIETVSLFPQFLDWKSFTDGIHFRSR